MEGRHVYNHARTNKYTRTYTQTQTQTRIQIDAGTDRDTNTNRHRYRHPSTHTWNEHPGCRIRATCSVPWGRTRPSRCPSAQRYECRLARCIALSLRRRMQHPACHHSRDASGKMSLCAMQYGSLAAVSCGIGNWPGDSLHIANLGQISLQSK